MLHESSLTRQGCTPQYAFRADVEVWQQCAPFWMRWNCTVTDMRSPLSAADV